jgi:hypothetical protein
MVVGRALADIHRHAGAPEPYRVAAVNIDHRDELSGCAVVRSPVARKQPWMWSLTMPVFCMNAYTLVGPT